MEGYIPIQRMEASEVCTDTGRARETTERMMREWVEEHMQSYMSVIVGLKTHVGLIARGGRDRC